jgi:hypothetical protein
VLPLSTGSLGAGGDALDEDVASDDDPPPAMPADCGGDGEDFQLGMSKTAPNGAWTVAIVAAEPAPPLVGPNSWTVRLTGEGGEAIPAAGVTLTGWMPAHRHGLNSVPLTRELDGGRYQIQPIYLFMPQLWELSVAIGTGDDREVVTFAFCVP